MKQSIAELLGPKGAGTAAAMRRGLDFLQATGRAQLLARLGTQLAGIPAFEPIDKRALQDSFGGNQVGPSDDLLVGLGLFYLSEQRRLFLDCTAGHYQMLWGYNHPVLCRALADASAAGIVWDNHSNIPQAPVKVLAQRLVQWANAPEEPDPLDTVLLGVCTGSVACAAALKIQWLVYQREKKGHGPPVFIVLEGNYHGTDLVAQHLRGLWPGLVTCGVVPVEPNDAAGLETAFRKYGERVAGFWAEPVLMNREAMAVEAEYLRLARRLCTEAGALMCIDEIQTGFWQPEIFAARALGVKPDLLIAGKGMTAGFHPLSAVIYKSRYDVLAQYDAISTNGSAALPSFLALFSLALIQEQAWQITAAGRQIAAGFAALAAEYPDHLEAAHGRAHLAGLKFKTVEQALQFHRRLLEAGLWTRVHAYHPGHRTVLTKLGLLADEAVVDFMLGQFRKILPTL